MTVPVTSSERELLHAIHVKADELARMLQEANVMGFHVNFNMNALLGTCDRFDVVKMVSIDLKGGAN